MLLTYVIDDDEFDYEPSHEELQRFCKWYFEDFSNEDFIYLLIENVTLEEYYDEIWSFLEDNAREWYKNACLLCENPYSQSDFI